MWYAEGFLRGMFNWSCMSVVCGVVVCGVLERLQSIRFLDFLRLLVGQYVCGMRGFLRVLEGHARVLEGLIQLEMC
jgi:hypothetical protein